MHNHYNQQMELEKKMRTSFAQSYYCFEGARSLPFAYKCNLDNYSMR